MVKRTACPAFTLVMSPSEISGLTRILLKSATFTMVGAVWTELTVCPSAIGVEIMVPSMGEVILV